MLDRSVGVLLAEIIARQDTRDAVYKKSSDGSPEEVRTAVQRELLEEVARLRLEKKQQYPNIIPIIERMLKENPVERISVRAAINAITSAMPEPTISVHLDADYTTFSPYDRAIESSAVDAVAGALGVSTKQIRPQGVRPGSVVVDLQLLSDHPDKSILALQQQLNVATSTLRWQIVGRLISKIETFKLQVWLCVCVKPCSC